MIPALPDRAGGLGAGELRARYVAGSVSPVEVVDEVYARIGERGQDHVWITLVEPEAARGAAAGLDPARIEELPLFGVPFAVKDNIDVAGMPTTAACPGFAYLAAASAPLVEALVAAGAILVGKTNLDQFATGLSGARSPFGTPASIGDPALISGGSSSGSAVAVAAGLVGFAIGTDTAGSGRVPAALNGIVGLKPSIGLVSTTGIVPACRSLDCASVFATTVADAQTVLAVIAGFDPDDPWARRFPETSRAPSAVALSGLRLAVPASVPGWGARGEPEAWTSYCDRLTGLGVELVPVELTGFFEAGELLYSGPWVAERLDGLEDVLARQPDVLLPVTRTILELGRAVRGTETFAALTRLQELRRDAAELLARVDALLTPTVTETFTIQEMLADPITLNTRLGRFTTFTNLLDLCAVAIPAGGGEVPFGVTLQAAAGRDGFVAGLGRALVDV